MRKKSIIVLVALLSTAAPPVSAQQKKLTYSIISKGDTVGQMQIAQRILGSDISYSVASTVTTKMLMTIKVNVEEEVQYYNNKLIKSSSQRMINDKPKANKRTEAHENYYLLSNDNNQDTLREKEITYDFSLLYFKEPVGVKKVFSNYYQVSLPIQQLDAHSYQINLPEGGVNTYYYSNGKCNRVDMQSPLFNAQMTLNP